MSDLGSSAHGIVDAEVIGGGCFCVPDTYTGAFGDSGALLVFVGGDFGLERSSKKGAAPELELGLVQIRVAQKPVLQVEVCVRALQVLIKNAVGR